VAKGAEDLIWHRQVGTQPEKLDAAIEKVYEIIEKWKMRNE